MAGGHDGGMFPLMWHDVWSIKDRQSSILEEGMMTKATILRCIAEIESKLAVLRAAVEQWPAVPYMTGTDALADLEQEGGLEGADALREVFATLRTAWNIPPDVQRSAQPITQARGHTVALCRRPPLATRSPGRRFDDLQSGNWFQRTA